MKHFEIGRDGLSKLYKAMTEEALDRIIGDRVSLPSPYHDRINLAHARLCALVAQHGAMPSKNRVLIELQGAGLGNQDILDVLDAFDVYDGREIITEGKLAVHLKRLGVAAIAENLRRARPVGAAAMAQACLAATQECRSDGTIALGVPLPTALAYLEPARSSLPAQRPGPTSTICPDHLEDDILDGPFSQVADAVIDWQLKEKLWDKKRGREVKASVALLVHANGDLAFAGIGQQHLHATVELMNALPKRYNHFMVAGQGGFAAALASVAIPGGESDEARKEREAKMGLHSGTRNKHLTWLKAIIEGAAVAGYTEHALNYRGLRHGSKQIKKRDKRKKHEKRPNWDLETWQRLTSGPVYEGCAGLDHRFKAGSVVFHDGVYFSPLIVLNICGRPSEGAGPEVGDVFDEAPIPYIYIRRNSLRGLKIDEGERKVPIHPRLIELGFLEYVRAVRAAGHVALFPEFVHPEGKLDFAWMMRDKAIDPAKALHFPNGTGLILYGKEPDGHSLRGTGRSALADGLPAVEEKMRNYISGHVSGRVGIDVYETPPPLEDVLRAIRKLDPWFAHLASKPLNLRPADRMKFGSPRGRPKEI